MTLIPGSIGLTGLAAPKDTTETFPALDPIYGIDGHRSVAAITDMNAITAARRRFGMTVAVYLDSTPANNGIYRLCNTNLGGVDNVITNNANFIFQSSFSLALGNIGSTPNAKGATFSAGTLTLQPASTSFGGVVTTGAQSFIGVKTFVSDIVLGTGGGKLRSPDGSIYFFLDQTFGAAGFSGPSASIGVGQDTSGSLYLNATSSAQIRLVGDVVLMPLNGVPSNTATQLNSNTLYFDTFNYFGVSLLPDYRLFSIQSIASTTENEQNNLTFKYQSTTFLTFKNLAGASTVDSATLSSKLILSSTAGPLRFANGTLLVTPINNTVECDGSHLYVTLAGTRYQLDQQSGGGSARIYSDVAYASTINVNAGPSGTDKNITAVTGNLILTTTNFTNGTEFSVKINKTTASNVVITLDATTIPGVKVQSPTSKAVVASNTITLISGSGVSFVLSVRYESDVPFGVITEVAIDNAGGGSNNQTLFVGGAVINGANNTTENTLYSYTIPGGTLTANSYLRIYYVAATPGGGNSGAITVRCKVGGNVLDSTALTVNTGSNPRQMFLFNNAAVNSNTYIPYNNTNATSGSNYVATTTATIDFSTDIIIVFTIQKATGSDTGGIGMVSVEACGIGL